MIKRIFAVGALGTFTIAAALVACGGDDVTGEGPTDASTDGTVNHDAGNDTGVMPGDSGNDVETMDAGGDAADGAPTTDAGDAAVPDGAITADGGVQGDAGPGGDAATLSCGAAGCSVPAQTCCVYQQDASAYAFACAQGTSCPTMNDAGAVALSCEMQEQCSGNTVCCISSSTGGQITASCRSSCTADAGGGEQVAHLCDPAAADAGCAVLEGACSSATISTWRLPSGFGTCGAKPRL